MKGNKIIATLLAGLTFVSFAGCSAKEAFDGDSNTSLGAFSSDSVESYANSTSDAITKAPAEPVGTVKDSDNVYIDGMLHKVDVTPSNNIFTSNKKTAYKFILGDLSNGILSASSFIAKHVKEATGALIEVEEEEATWSTSAKYIVLGDSEMFQSAGLSMPTENLGPVGYYIKTMGKSVFIMAKNKEGYQLAAIAFLRAVLGYDMISDDTVIYEKDGSMLPKMDIVERPDYDVRVFSNGGMSQGTAYGMGYTEDWGMMLVEGKNVHNSLSYIPPEKYLETNPDWYSDVLQTVGSTQYRQVCYTAHGNEKEYELMQNTIIEKMMESVIAEPEKSVISFTQQDVNAYCKCDNCKAVEEEYGVPSAAIIMFCNGLGEKLDAALTKLAEDTGEEKREIKLCFFAYHWSEAPPVVKNSKGEYEPIDEKVVCRDNVAVFIASIETKYYYSFYDEVNEYYAENMRGWMALTNTILLWLYQTNYGEYLYPYNTWDTQIENYRYGKTMGANYMFCQGQKNHSNSTGFTKLKEYIDSKALFDLNVNGEELTDKWFKCYFLDAEKPMRQFFDEMQAHLYYLQTEYTNELTGYIRDPLAKSKYWPYRTVQHWLELIDEAYDSIEKYKTTNVDLYNKLREHIMLESIFPRFVMCDLLTGYVSAKTLKAMRQEFYNDATELGITLESEHVSLSTVYEKWGIS